MERNQFPEVSPPIGQIVIVDLSVGPSVESEWDGEQWWCHLNDSPDAVPLDNRYVTHWRLE